MINVSCHALMPNTYYFSQSRVLEKAILNPPAACNGYTWQILFKVRSLEVFNINFNYMLNITQIQKHILIKTVVGNKERIIRK